MAPPATTNMPNKCAQLLMAMWRKRFRILPAFQHSKLKPHSGVAALMLAEKSQTSSTPHNALSLTIYEIIWAIFKPWLKH
jgi:hypothetical protein